MLKQPSPLLFLLSPPGYSSSASSSGLSRPPAPAPGRFSASLRCLTTALRGAHGATQGLAALATVAVELPGTAPPLQHGDELPVALRAQRLPRSGPIPPAKHLFATIWGL